MKLTNITQKNYYEQLGVLPPAAMSDMGFLIGEPTTHKGNDPVYASYFKIEAAGSPDNTYLEGENLTVAEFKAYTEDQLIKDVEDAEMPEDVQRDHDLREQYGDGAVDAYIDNFGKLDEDFEEAYVGKYDSDEDFAQQMAEDIGAIDRNVQWPNNCIAWGLAARELMYDYWEGNGHYFRNM